MNNYYFPKISDIPQNLFQTPIMQNDNSIQSQTNQFSLPLNINQIAINNPNIQNQLLNLLYPDQFLYQNPLYFLPRLLLIPQANQINYLNQLITEQNIRNSNDLMGNNNINNIYNSLFNNQQFNILNQNILGNLINNKSNINEQNKPKENDEKINNQPGKKFLITHENTNPQNSNNQKNDKNINNDKKTIENNSLYSNLLKNNNINNNNLKINEKTEENKEIKGKFSLFTISNINTNINNNSNNVVNNNSENLDKPKLNPPIIKFQLQNDELNKIKAENIIDNELNKLNNSESNKYLFNLQHLDEKQDKDKIKYYRCSFKECNKVFLKQSNLKDHIRTHTGEKPYICLHPGCGKTFSQHGNLKKHEKIHSGNKKYYCSYPNCGKKFSASYNLKIHYRCHTGERPYKCNFPNCGREFYDKGNLKYHEKNMHALENMEFPYSCEHMGCNAKFRTKLEKLKHHSEMEVDCYKERKELIKLIQRYKIFLKKIIRKKGIDENKNEVVLKLKKNYEEIRNKLIDKELFNYYLGESFENECTNVEEINSENEVKNDENSSKENHEMNIKEENEIEEEEINDNEDNKDITEEQEEVNEEGRIKEEIDRI